MTERETDRAGGQRLTVQEAAKALGTTTDAIRMRVRRGTLGSEKDEDGRVYVYVDPLVEGRNGDVSGVESHVEVQAYEALVEDLRGQVGYLREELRQEREQHREADRENRRIIAGLIQRVPELEPGASQEAPDDRESVREGYGQDEAPGDPQMAAQRPERGFWSRLFGG